MEWRFLAHASDDEPGFSTAWLRQQSLKRQADRREREYKQQVLDGFAEEFGMTSPLPSHVDQGVQDCSEGDDDDDAEEEREDIISILENTSAPSRIAPDVSSLHLDRLVSPEVYFFGLFTDTRPEQLQFLDFGNGTRADVYGRHVAALFAYVDLAFPCFLFPKVCAVERHSHQPWPHVPASLCCRTVVVSAINFCLVIALLVEI